MAAPLLEINDLDALVSSEGFATESAELSGPTVPPRDKDTEVDETFATFTENATTIRPAPEKIVILDNIRQPTLDDAAVGSFGAQLLELIIQNDDRRKVQNVLESPWKKIAALVITSQSGTQYAGTGWFISPRVLVTAGHCVFLHDVGGFPAKIEVTPAMDGTKKPFGSHTATKFMSSNGWVNDRNSDYDYGLIILDEKAHEDIGWFGFAAAPDEYLNGKIVNVSGYPRDPDKYTYQYYHAKEIDRSSKHKVYYTADTTGGDSGTCLWLTLGESERVVIGLHTTGGSITNFGTRITEPMFKNFKKVKDEYQ